MISIFMSIVLLAFATGISFVAAAGAGVTVLGIAGTIITAGICGSGTPAATEPGETPGAELAPSKSRWAWASAVTHLSKMCFQSLLYLHFEGSQRSSSSFITTFALKFVGRAPSTISTCVYSAKTPLSIIMRLMLL